MNIGKKIKQARQERQLSQKQLADLANISATYLCDVEKGRCDGSVRILQSIAGALQIELSELLK